MLLKFTPRTGLPEVLLPNMRACIPGGLVHTLWRGYSVAFMPRLKLPSF